MAVFTGNGSNTAPSFTFSSDTDTGFYRYDTDQVALTLGGSDKMILTPNNANIYLPITGPSNFNSSWSDNSGAATNIPLVPQAGGYSVVGVNNRAAGNNASFLRFGNVTAPAFSNRSASWIGAVYNLNYSSNLYFYSGKKTNTTIAFNDSALNAIFEQDQIRFYTGAQGASDTSLKASITTAYLRMASGTGGIQFNGDTASANALDDYEEGTWTPVLMDAVSTVLTVSSSNASYVKVGRMCTIYGTLTGITSTAVSSVYYINNLPFNARYSSFGGSTPVTRGGTVMIKYSGGGTGVGTARTYQSSPTNCEFITTTTLTELYFTITYTTT